MLTAVCMILIFLVFGKILWFAIKAAWGISKIIVSVVLLPLFLIGLVLKGVFFLAVPALLIVGIISLFGLRD